MGADVNAFFCFSFVFPFFFSSSFEYGSAAIFLLTVFFSFNVPERVHTGLAGISGYLWCVCVCFPHLVAIASLDRFPHLSSDFPVCPVWEHCKPSMVTIWLVYLKCAMWGGLGDKPVNPNWQS